MTKEYKNPETIGLHAGWRKDETTNSVAVPLDRLLASSVLILLLSSYDWTTVASSIAAANNILSFCLISNESNVAIFLTE